MQSSIVMLIFLLFSTKFRGESLKGEANCFRGMPPASVEERQFKIRTKCKVSCLQPLSVINKSFHRIFIRFVSIDF